MQIKDNRASHQNHVYNRTLWVYCITLSIIASFFSLSFPGEAERVMEFAGAGKLDLAQYFFYYYKNPAFLQFNFDGIDPVFVLPSFLYRWVPAQWVVVFPLVFLFSILFVYSKRFSKAPEPIVTLVFPAILFPGVGEGLYLLLVYYLYQVRFFADKSESKWLNITEKAPYLYYYISGLFSALVFFPSVVVGLIDMFRRRSVSLLSVFFIFCSWVFSLGFVYSLLFLSGSGGLSSGTIGIFFLSLPFWVYQVEHGGFGGFIDASGISWWYWTSYLALINIFFYWTALKAKPFKNGVRFIGFLLFSVFSCFSLFFLLKGMAGARNEQESRSLLLKSLLFAVAVSIVSFIFTPFARGGKGVPVERYEPDNQKYTWFLSVSDIPFFPYPATGVERLVITDLKIIPGNLAEIRNSWDAPDAALDFNIPMKRYLEAEDRYSSQLWESRNNYRVSIFLHSMIHPAQETEPVRRVRIYWETLMKEQPESKLIVY